MVVIQTYMESRIEPTITFCGEIWDLNKGQTKELNKIMDNILKRILKVLLGKL